MTEWRRKNWLVTGASSGFGLALVEAVLAGGGRVIAATRNPEALEAIRGDAGERLVPLRLDITNAVEIEAAVADIEARLGGIDVLANNAGYGLLGGIEESSDAEIRALFEVNFFSAVTLTRAVLPGMRGRRSGFIVNMSSVSGVKGIAGSGFYAATKFALEGMSEALGRECAPLGIRVMIVEPGAFRTGFLEVWRKRTARRIEEYTAVEARRQAEAARGFGPMGDPVRGVASILQAMESDEPPERLVLGATGAKLVRKTYERRLAELLEWLPVATAADDNEGC